MFSKPFPQKSCSLWDNVEKYGTARQVTDDNIMLCRKHSIRMTDNHGINTDTHIRNIEHLLLFHGKNGYANAPQSYVIHTSPLLL